jgi:hypothetical protein
MQFITRRSNENILEELNSRPSRNKINTEKGKDKAAPVLN